MHKKTMPFNRYSSYPSVTLSDRAWPAQSITCSPIWCSTDLRDGNQALSVPMDIETKIQMFELLVAIGFKEIEVGFPSASQIEFQFVRKLIEEKRIPEDVTIQVLTQARFHLIERTFEAIHDAKNAIIHLYNSTSKVQREVVFQKDKEEIKSIAMEGARLVRSLVDRSTNSGLRFEYSPESFPGTELDYALEVCNAVISIWNPAPQNKMIINLPTTVEMSTPNVFADQVEWMRRNIHNRDAVIISVHTHNDRGTAVASAELAIMAGAERVEGALFGNGERSGNMDIITMALNLFSQGIDPQLDFSNINQIREVYKQCTQMDIHSRHPYVGELVYTAFSGSHQDAINKGMKAQSLKETDVWEVPYLPIDPQDVGRSYEAIIRINSQSGKGGVAYIMENDWGIKIPKEMQPDFAGLIQALTEQKGRDLSSEEIKKCFYVEYLHCDGFYQLKKCDIHSGRGDHQETLIQSLVQVENSDVFINSSGNGPVDAFVCGIKKQVDMDFEVVLYSEHSLSSGSDAQAVAYIGIKIQNDQIFYGAGIDANISIASIKAVISALNRREK